MRRVVVLPSLLAIRRAFVFQPLPMMRQTFLLLPYLAGRRTCLSLPLPVQKYICSWPSLLAGKRACLLHPLLAMKRVFWLLPLLALPMAQAQPGLGRLFNTPQERQTIDASRSKSAGSGAAYPRGGAGLTGELAQTEAQRMAGGVSPSMQQGLMPGMPPVQSAPGMPPEMQMPSSTGMAQGRLPGLAPDVVPDLPPNMPPGMQAEMIAMARAAREMAPAQNQAAAMAQQQQQPPQMQQMQQMQQMPMPMPGSSSASAADTPQLSEQLTMNGVLRSSNGRSTVWLNNQPQRGAANKFTNRDSKAVTVTLPSGKRIVLQPGQRYDLADGRVKDVSQ